MTRTRFLADVECQRSENRAGHNLHGVMIRGRWGAEVLTHVASASGIKCTSSSPVNRDARVDHLLLSAGRQSRLGARLEATL
jgi:hypothetical protein